VASVLLNSPKSYLVDWTDFREARHDDLEFVVSEPGAIAEQVRECDLVVGSVLRRGDRAPYVVTEALVTEMPEAQ
jgi:alanine dehydrogenase